MNDTVERIQIVGLHGNKTVDVRVKDNTLILVGENGSGKTTFLRILFHFLSGRWVPLIQFPFEYVSCTIGGTERKVTREEVVTAFRVSDRRFLSEVPPPYRRKLIELFERGEVDQVYVQLEKLGDRYGFRPERILRQLEFFDEKPKGSKKELADTIEKIKMSISAQILYLPTYRRIERELTSIFEGIDPDRVVRQKSRFPQVESDEAYIELVEFGMKDVQQAVDSVLEGLKEFAREDLNTLTLRYLGDVMNEGYQNVGMDEIAAVSEDTVRSVLDRIHESILAKEHKDHLFSVINSARSAGAPTEHEKIIYHYFLKLLAFQESLQQREQRISAFCELCSEYLVDKRFVYDSSTFSFTIAPKNDDHLKWDVGLSDLSSGEKQIVSLFSHLYLSGRQRFFVLIDEPELSLSVLWQRRFLIDIRRGAFCAGLVAATHSPFVYDNEFQPYAHSLGEFVDVRGH